MAGPWERYSEVPKAPAAPWLRYQQPSTPEPAAETPTTGPWTKYATPQSRKADKLPVAEPPASLTDYAAEGAKAIGRGAVGIAGTALKGGAVLDPAQGSAAAMESYKPDLLRVPDMTPDELGAFRQRLSADTTVAGMQAQQAVSDILEGVSPEEVMAGFPAPTPLEERTLFKAGETVGEFAEESMPAAPGWEDSVTATLGEGLGSLFAGFATAGVLGPVASGGLFVGAGAGEAADRAIQFDQEEKAAGRPGLTEEQKITAAMLGVAPGATDLVPIEFMLGALKVPTPFRKPVARAVARIGGQAFIEGLQEGGQQFLQNLIAQEVYDPQQELGEGVVPNTAAGGGVGGISQGLIEIGGLFTGRHRGGRVQEAPEEAVPAPPEEAPIAAEEITQERQNSAAREAITSPEEINPSDGPAPPGTDMGNPISTEPPSREERALLRGAGWTDEQITDMDPAERAEAMSEARTQGVEPVAVEEKGVAQTDTLADDTPSAEPASDLIAQARDLADPENPRRAVYLPPEAAKRARETGTLKEIVSTSGGRVITFNGGVLVVRDDETANEARAAIKAGEEPQAIVGRLVGAGTGKPADGTDVVQQVDADGNVTRESLVRPEEVETTAAEFGAEGREVRVVSPEEALQRREDLIAAEPPVAAATPKKPVAVETEADLEQARARVNTEPTDGQKEAGNYARGFARIQGIDIAIETPKGSRRSGKNRHGEEWTSPVFQADYGRIKGVKGADGDDLDVFVGPDPQSDRVFIIDQLENRTGKFDELKTVMGAKRRQEAIDLYRKSFSDGGGDRIGGVTEMSVEEFKRWLRAGDATKPLTTTPAAKNIPENIPAPSKKPQKTAKPQSLIAFLGANGGVRDFKGEIARGLGLPGHVRARFVRAKGKTLDQAREAAAEAGYFDHIYGTAERAVAESTPDDLLTLIDQEARGEKVYASADRATVEEEKAARENERARDRARAEVEELIGGGDPELADRATELVLQGVDAGDAVERASIQLADESYTAEDKAATDEVVDVPFFDTEPQPERLPEGGERRRSAGEEGRERSAAREGAEDGGEAIPPRRPDQGPEGRSRKAVIQRLPGQTDLFGGAKASDKDLAQRKADAPLKPKVEQKPADVGLFSDERAQTDLVDRARKARSEPKPTRLTNADKAEIKAEVTAIVMHLAGRDTPILFQDQIPVEQGADERYQRDMGGAAEAGGYELAQTVGGYYESTAVIGEDLIAVALADPIYRPRSTAYHESWHRIEQFLLTAAEHAILATDLAKGPRSVMRRLAAEKMRVTATDPFMQELPDYEITALAFERFMELREIGPSAVQTSGLHIALRRAFDRIAEIIRQIRALLTGRGVTSVDELFTKAAKGEMGRRADYITARNNLRAAGLSDQQIADMTEAVRREREPAEAPRRAARFSIARPSGGMAGIPYQVQSVQRTRAERILDRVRKITDPTRIKIQDRVLAIRRMQEQIERETGIRIPESLDVYAAEALYHGKAGERLVDLKRQHVEPLIAKMKELGVDAATLDEYLYARHAPERNAAIRQIDPKNNAGSGMTDAEAAATMRRLQPQMPALQQLAGMVDTLVRDTREAMVRDGLISRDTADAWAQKYPHYVPLRGFETDDDSEAGVRIGRGMDVRGPESQQALGRRSKSDSPLAYIVMQAEQAIVRGEKNRVGRTLLRMVQTFTDPDVWQVAQAEMKRRINPKTGLVETYAVLPAFSKSDNLFAVKVGGKTTWIDIKHEGVARALRGASFGGSGSIAKAIFRLARGYSALVTSLSPEFVPTNWARDLQTALVNVSDIANKPAGVRRQIVKDALSLKAIRGTIAALRDPSSNKEYAKWFEEFRHAGGKISFLDLNDIGEIKRQIEKELKNAGRSGADPRVVFGKFLEAVEIGNTAVENSARLSTYVALRKAGVSQQKAAFVARELTVNFNRKGEISPWLNAAYLFFNASAQGTARLAQAVARSKTVRRAVLGIFAAGAVMDLLNTYLSPEDDDGESAYDKIPDWVKERNLIIMNPQGGGDYVMIPMPYGYNAPFLAGQNVMATLRGAKKPLEAALTVGSATLSAFNPLGMAPTFGQFLSPTLLDPVVQQEENMTFYGGPIYPFRPPSSHKPDAESYFKSAPEWAKTIAKTLNEATGGNVGRGGLIDISPETIEHYVEFVGGGLGRFASNAVQTAEKFIAGEEWMPEETPFLRRFYGKPTTASQRREFYDAFDAVDAARYEVNQLGKAGRGEEQRTAREANAPLLRAYGPLNAIKKELDNLDDRRDAVNAKDLPADQRRKELEAIDIRERGLLKRALQIYGDARRG